MKPRIEPTRKERLADKLDRLRDPLVPANGTVKKRPKRTLDDLARWDYSGGRDEEVRNDDRE